MRTGHLRLLRPERSYVVSRTRLVFPGRPYIVAECAPGTTASAPEGLEMFPRTTMLREPSLRDALAAWEEHDDALLRRDGEAIERLRRGARPVSPSEQAARAAHPSAVAKRLFVPRPGSPG